MIHITAEGSKLRRGLNVYPWSERRYSIGARMVVFGRKIGLRWNGQLKHLYLMTNRRSLRLYDGGTRV